MWVVIDIRKREQVGKPYRDALKAMSHAAWLNKRCESNSGQTPLWFGAMDVAEFRKVRPLTTTNPEGK